MNVVERLTGKVCQVEVVPVESADYKSLSKAKYFFNWKTEKNEEVYKLVIKGQKEILGLISVERISLECRIHIRLLTVSRENQGSAGLFKHIAGNLIAHVAKIAVAEFAEFACVSLIPKSALAQHYINKYKMNVTGMTLSLEVPQILNLISQYDHE
jgi:hypothetical protein